MTGESKCTLKYCTRSNTGPNRFLSSPMYTFMFLVSLWCGPTCMTLIPMCCPFVPVQDPHSLPEPAVMWSDKADLSFSCFAFSLLAHVCRPHVSSLWCFFFPVLFICLLCDRQGISYSTPHVPSRSILSLPGICACSFCFWRISLYFDLRVMFSPGPVVFSVFAISYEAVTVIRGSNC